MGKQKTKKKKDKQPDLEVVYAHQLTLSYVKDRKDIFIDIDGILDLSSSNENDEESQEEIEEDIDEQS